MKKHYPFNTLVFIGLLLCFGLQNARAQFYYGLKQEYGKNRVQYNQFEWVFYRFERFDVYFYRNNDKLAAEVSRMTNEELPRIESLLDAPLDDRLKILVFNSITDLKQSNVNSNNEEDYNTGGVTRISGRRLFVYFDGDYIKLKHNLRAGLAEVVLSNLVYGSFTESIRNSALLNLPEWYTEGIISYIGNPDDKEVDIHVRDAYLSGRYKNINSLTGDDATYAGHSLWQYIADTYGTKVLKSILYMAIVNRNIESGFLYILGKDLNEVNKAWRQSLAEKYSQGNKEDPFPEKSLVKAHRGYEITHMATSNDGRYLVYSEQKFSRYKIFLYDFQTGKRKRLLTDGFRIAQNADQSYPIFAFHPNGKMFAMFTEEKGLNYLSFYNIEDKKWEKKPFYRLNKILSFQYSPDGKQFLMSADKNGQSDIFIYTILNTKLEQLTNDNFNDLYPTYIMGGKRIVFSSNMDSDTLIKNEIEFSFENQNHDLFSMPAAEPEEDTTVIWRLTNTPDANEIEAKSYADGYVAFLSDRSGMQNRHLIAIDSAVAFVDTATHYDYSFKEYQLTNYTRSLLAESFVPGRDINLDLAYYNRHYRLYKTPYLDPRDLNLHPVKKVEKLPMVSDTSGLKEPEENQFNNAVPLYYPGIKASDFEVNIDDYNFDNADEAGQQTPRKEKDESQPLKLLPEPVQAAQTEESKKDTLQIPPKRNYFLSFYQDGFKVRFDNMFDNPQYQRFTGGNVSSDLLNSGFNAGIQVGVIDLMHDYKIFGAMRTNFQPLNGTSIAPNAEFLVGYGDYKKRWDKEYTLSRRSQVQIDSYQEYTRIISNEVTEKLTFPFNPVASIRGSLGYRIDQFIQLSRETVSANTPTRYQDYLIARLAYVYDNTRKIGLNLYSGLRYKIFTEYYRNLYKKPTGMHTAGIDLRNYTIIYKNFIWANRFAAGTSFGPEKLIYVMGGVDNAFSPKFDPTTPIAKENNYVFQTLITNMRGFYQNVRNGNSFALINSELRLPFFSFLFKKPIRSDFIKNFQVVGFTDAGTAWNGWSPYSSENAINTRTISRGNLKIILDSQSEPIVLGYGVGLRTRLFGYFLRFDWGWGLKDGVNLPPEFTFSLATDF